MLSLTVVFLLAVSIPASFIFLSSKIGPRRPNPDKEGAYECGITPKSDARKRFPVKFYLVAVFFILFDIEVAFIYPWAVNFRTLGVAGLVGMLTFILVLVVGLIYVVQKGALKWD
ncbi:MAG: NADH-quinone oxidoreductase subunit A [Planctomycetes bacterium]|nr:NADH-quinone oxidoreductase subunit A [Planctomycetota bacterium]